jgi:hypothetical protein
MGRHVEEDLHKMGIKQASKNQRISGIKKNNFNGTNVEDCSS